MNLHGTQRPLGARVVREGFWEEATLIRNRLCYGWGDPRCTTPRGALPIVFHVRQHGGSNLIKLANARLCQAPF